MPFEIWETRVKRKACAHVDVSTMSYQPDFTDKVAIVAGGGKGMGRAIASGPAGAGAKAVVAGRMELEIEEVADKIISRGGNHCKDH